MSYHRGDDEPRVYGFKLVRTPVLLTVGLLVLQAIIKPLFIVEVPVGYGAALAFGGSVGDTTLGEGPHLKWPWLHAIFMNLRTVADSRETTPTDSNNQAISATVVPQIWIDPAAIPALARNYGTFEGVIKNVVDPQINQATRGTVSHHSPEELIWTRAAVVGAVRHSLQESIGEQLEAKGVKPNAVHVGLVAITNFGFSDPVRQTLEKKAESLVKAKTAKAQATIRSIVADKDGQVTEFTADGDAEYMRIIAKANAYKAEKVGQAAAAAASVAQLEAIQRWIDAGGHSSRVQLAPGAQVIINSSPSNN